MIMCSGPNCIAIVSKLGQRCPPHQVKPELRPSVPSYSPHYNKPAGWPFAPGKEPQPDPHRHLSAREVFTKLQEQISGR